MHVVFHLGSHCTDEDRLVRCLLKNKGRLAAEGIVVPGPSRYRTMLRDTLAALHGAQATPEAQAVLLDALMDEDEAVRLILSNDQFLCFADRVLEGGTLYADAGTRGTKGPDRCQSHRRGAAGGTAPPRSDSQR